MPKTSRHKWLWLLVAGLLYVAVIYLVNPNNRIYSSHGFFHAGIFYQILNGHIPPSQPFLAGQPLLYPWGFHLISAGFSLVFRISPFWSFAIINTLSLLLAMILVFKISSLLWENSRANIFSVFFALFGVHPWLTGVINALALRSLGVRVFTKTGIPVIGKFTNVNALPLGLVCFLLCLNAMLIVFKSRTLSWKPFFTLLFALLGVIFIYPPFIIGMASSLGVLLLLLIIGRNKQDRRVNLLKFWICAGIFCLALLLWYPYLAPISAGLGHMVSLFRIKHILKNLISLSLLFLPIILIAGRYWKTTKHRFPNGTLAVMAAFFIGNSLSYILVHQYLANEYKYQILASVTLGILAGLAISQAKLKRTALWLLLLVFFIPSGYNFYAKMTRHPKVPRTVVEQGLTTGVVFPEEEALYRWIRDHTPGDSVFMDSKAVIPIFAQRQLWICSARIDRLGFGAVPLNGLFRGYDDALIRQRRQTLEAGRRNGFQMPVNIVKSEDFGDRLYLVIRRSRRRQIPNIRQWQAVYESPNRAFTVYQFRISASHPGG